MLLFLYFVLFVCANRITCDLERNLALRSACGVSNEDYVLTSLPSLDEFPWMSVIAYHAGNSTVFKCTGTVISPQYILTSAQCVENIAYVRIGEYNLSTELDCLGDFELNCLNSTQDIDVEEKIVHNNFTINSKINDIALLRLKKKIDFSFDNAGAVCLPTSTDLQNTSKNKSRGKIVVWGLKASNNAMRKYNVWLTALEECYNKCNRSRLSSSSEEFRNSMHCVRKEDLYNADIGGPLLFKNTNGRYALHGVASEETSECVFYTHVIKYIKWILENIRE